MCPEAPHPVHPLPLSTTCPGVAGPGSQLLSLVGRADGPGSQAPGFFLDSPLEQGKGAEHEAWMNQAPAPSQEASWSGPSPWRGLTNVLPGHLPRRDSVVSTAGSQLLQQSKDPGLGPASQLLAGTLSKPPPCSKPQFAQPKQELATPILQGYCKDSK